MIKRLDADDDCPARDGFSMPPEWSTHARCWMIWPCRVEAWGSRDGLLRAKQAYARVARAISTFEPVVMAVRPQDAAEPKLACAGRVETFEVPVNDSWARDTGPTFLIDADGNKAAIQWVFNAWGHKYSDYAQDAVFASKVAQALDRKLYYAPLTCEGGAIHSDGEGAILTTEQTLLNENRNPHLSRQQVEERLALYTGAQKIIWLGNGFSDDETDGHIDNIACFAGPGKVILGIPSSKSHPDYGPVMDTLHRLKHTRDARGRLLEIIELEQPAKQRQDWRGRLLQSSYINFYLANGGIVMPSFDDAHDDKARNILADCFSGRDIIQVEALDIVQGGGGIHCITQQEPA